MPRPPDLIPTFTAEELRAQFRYDPETGQFWRLVFGRTSRRKISPKPERIPIEKLCKSVSGCGYQYIMVNSQRHRAHRLAWYYMTGEWPSSYQIDHINNQRLDNRWKNLRKATWVENSCNQRLSEANTSGIKGVTYNSRKRKWCSEVMVNRKSHFCGCFITKEEAEIAVKRKRIELHGEFTNHG